jgi:DNA segregation ATPase FtsK/SpoIIIE-like protein
MGRFDIPIIQLQPPFVTDLLESNILVFGAAMSGKTTFIKTLVHILHKQYNETTEQIFILDFGGAWSEYTAFPLVSAYFDNSNEEYVKRIFKIMDNILKQNIVELNGKNFRDSDHQPIHTTFIIDNLNAFMEEPRYASYCEKLSKLCRDGLSKGITIVATAGDTKGLISFLGNFKQKVAFEMPQDKYSEIFTGKVGLIGTNPGHGFANVTVRPEGVTGNFRMNLPYEVQCAVSEPNSEEVFENALHKKFEFSNGQYNKCVKKYQTFPKELTKDEYERLKQYPQDEQRVFKSPVSVGLDYVDFYPVQADLEQSHVIAIYGKREFGKTNLLQLLLNGSLEIKKECRFVLLDDGRNQLQAVQDSLPAGSDVVMINKFEEKQLTFKEREPIQRKLSPLNQFYIYLNENYCNLDKRFLAGMYGVNRELTRELDQIPNCKNEQTPFTVFVIQSKLVYLNTQSYLINNLLPQLVAISEEKGYAFIFSDVQKISDSEQNSSFNNLVTTAFLLDNIAEFAGERGQKTLFGNMDVKALKEDYAKCEKGDGYFYDVEADNLLKLKFTKF